MTFDAELQTARRAAQAAADRIAEIYESAEDLEIQRKGDDSPLTLADLAANRIICETLRAEFPDDAVLTEEEVDSPARLDARRVWIIDPLDGTKEFISRNGEFTVNVALALDGQPVVGVVVVPAQRTTYWASEDQGAWRLGPRDGKATRLHVSDRRRVEDMVLVASRSHAGARLKAFAEAMPFADVRSRGSSLKGCMVAEGEADVYFRFGPTNEWDICAMQMIVTEAGGAMTNLDGRPMTYNNPNPLNDGFAVSNGPLHDYLIEAAHRCAPPENNP